MNCGIYKIDIPPTNMKLLLKNKSVLPKDSVFVVGVPSTGNVGQLATDCLISTLYAQDNLEMIGSIESSLVLPMIGYESFSANKSEPQLCMPIEVYRVKVNNVVLILQRSLCIKGAQRLFSQQLHHLLMVELEGKSMILLTGASTEDVESASSQPMFSIASSEDAVAALTVAYPALSSSLGANFASNAVLPPASALLASAAHSVGYGEANNDAMLSLEQVQFEFAELNMSPSEQQHHQQALANAQISHALSAALPRGMTAVKYVLEAHYRHTGRSSASADAASTSSVLVLGKICTEGDNIPDGVQLAAQVLGLLSLCAPTEATVSLEKLSQPASWGNKFGRGISSQAVNMFF